MHLPLLHGTHAHELLLQWSVPAAAAAASRDSSSASRGLSYTPADAHTTIAGEHSVAVSAITEFAGLQQVVCSLHQHIEILLPLQIAISGIQPSAHSGWSDVPCLLIGLLASAA